MTHPLDIPVVDLADLASSPAARARAADALRVAFGTFGLVYVRSHGVDAASVHALYDDFLSFARRPVEDKRRFGRADLWYQRGWTPPSTEKAVVATGQPDFKECWFAAPTSAEFSEIDRASYPEIYADDVWPDASPGFDAARFRERYLRMGRELHAAGVALLRLSAVALDLAETTFTDAIARGPHVTRLLHYLPLAEDQIGTGIVWGEEHTDFNLLTLLPGGRFYSPGGEPGPRPDDRSGLYLRTRATEEAPRGRLVRGVAPEGCIIAQVGEQLEVLTGGALLATPHVITAPATAGWSRMSSAHFVHAHTSQVLFPLEKFRDPRTISAYAPPVLAGTYDLKTLADIGLAPRSALDKLGYRHHARFAPIGGEGLSRVTG